MISSKLYAIIFAVTINIQISLSLHVPHTSYVYSIQNGILQLRSSLGGLTQQMESFVAPPEAQILSTVAMLTMPAAMLPMQSLHLFQSKMVFDHALTKSFHFVSVSLMIYAIFMLFKIKVRDDLLPDRHAQTLYSTSAFTKVHEITDAVFELLHTKIASFLRSMPSLQIKFPVYLSTILMLPTNVVHKLQFKAILFAILTFVPVTIISNLMASNIERKFIPNQLLRVESGDANSVKSEGIMQLIHPEKPYLSDVRTVDGVSFCTTWNWRIT